MASPQKENGYTAIANELLEALMRTQLSANTRQVFDTVIRKTYGFQKKSDRLPLSQISCLTGLKTSAICKAIRNLKAMKMISRDDRGNTMIVKDYAKWTVAKQPVAKQTIASGQIDNSASGQIATLKRKGQKKLYKRNFNKLKRGKPLEEPMNQDIDRSFPRTRLYGDETVSWFLDYFEFKMERKLGGKEVWNRRYAKHIKRKIGAEVFRRLLDWLADPKCWWHIKVNQMENIYKNVDTLVFQMEKGEPIKTRKTPVTII